MAWEPLSVREGWTEPVTHQEGVPDHLKRPLIDWVASTIHPPTLDGPDSEALCQIVLVRLNIPTPGSDSYWTTLRSACKQNEEVLLTTIDALLLVDAVRSDDQSLRSLLEMGGSVWTVSPSRKSLERRVDSTAREAASAAVAPDDEAATELAQAWSEAFGRHPDPSDAWDHAIKAVEAVAIPAVCPKKDKANLGTVAGQLKAQPEQFHFTLGDVTTVESMIRRMWVNPDRHRGAEHRNPTQREAEAVVMLAVTLVQWFRTGAIRRKGA